MTTDILVFAKFSQKTTFIIKHVYSRGAPLCNTDTLFWRIKWRISGYDTYKTATGQS